MRPFLPLVFAGLGLGTAASHWVRPLGGGSRGVVAVAVATFTDPVFLSVLVVAPVLLALAPVLVVRLLPGLERACPRALRTGLVPVAMGAGLPTLTPLMDPWLFRCPAPALLWVGAGVGLLATLWRLLTLRPADAPLPGGGRIGLVAVALLLAALPAWPGAQGDEPHYLMVATSIVRDGDLDVADEYGDGEYRAFHPGPLSPHYKPGLRHGSRYSMHGIGYGLVLAPAVAVSDALGWPSPVPLARAVQALAYGLFVWVLWGLLASLVGSRAATMGTAAAAFLGPLVLAPLHLFPETWLMLLGVAGYRLAAEERTGSRLGAGLALAALPWLAIKAIPMALVLAGLACWAHRPGGAWRRTLPVLGPLVASLALHAVFTWLLYGSLSPSALYLGADPQFGRPPGYGDSLGAYLADWPVALRTLVGYVLDQKEGLLFTGPHWLLAAAGLPWCWRHRRRHLLVLGLACAAYVGPYALSQQIGGQSPPSRPLMAVLWMAAVPLGVALAGAMRPLGQLLRGGLLAGAATLTAVFFVDPEVLPHDYPVTRSWLLRGLSPRGAGLADWFPLWLNVREDWPWMVALAWLLAALILLALLVRGGATLSRELHRPGRRGWVAATLGIVAGGAIMLYGASLVVTDRHVGAEIAAGVTGWVRDALPERAWAEPGGVWVGPGATREVVLTARPALQTMRVRLRTLVPTRTVVWLGGRRVRHEEEQQVVEVGWQPGRGHAWRDTSAYRVLLHAAAGASPAETEGGEDHRLLGIFLQLYRSGDER